MIKLIWLKIPNSTEPRLISILSEACTYIDVDQIKDDIKYIYQNPEIGIQVIHEEDYYNPIGLYSPDLVDWY